MKVAVCVLVCEEEGGGELVRSSSNPPPPAPPPPARRRPSPFKVRVAVKSEAALRALARRVLARNAERKRQQLLELEAAAFQAESKANAEAANRSANAEAEARAAAEVQLLVPKIPPPPHFPLDHSISSTASSPSFEINPAGRWLANQPWCETPRVSFFCAFA